jgi:hypothetical protein
LRKPFGRFANDARTVAFSRLSGFRRVALSPEKRESEYREKHDERDGHDGET